MPPGVRTSASPVARLRVLLVEDCADDAQLIIDALRHSGFDPSCVRVETEQEYLVHLTPDVDVILADSDYSLPQFDGRRALALANESGFDTPFIIVSSAMGEERAVAAMQTGATDYLLKDRLARLGTAVRRALEAAALRQSGARAKLAERSSAARTAAILDMALDGIFIIDEANTITEFNHAAAQMFGRTRADVIGRPIDEWLQPAQAATSTSAVARAGTLTSTVEPGHRVEMTAHHADGRRFPVELVLTRVPAAGKAQFAGLLRDISERKSHEAATLERNRLSAFARDVGVAFTEAGSLAALLDLCAQLIIAQLGAVLAQIWTLPEGGRYELAASAGHPSCAALPDGSAPAMFCKLDEVVRTRNTIATNVLIDDPRADREWASANGVVSFVGYPLIVGERVVGVMAMFGRAPFSEATVQAISYIANAVASAIERDRSEASRAQLAAIVEATTDLVSIRMLDYTGVAYMNQAGRTMLGLGPEDVVPDLAEFRTKECLRAYDEVTLPTALRDGLWTGETTLVSRDARVIPVSQMLLAHATPDGRIQLSTIARDITERLCAQEALRTSDERMRFALEAAHMGVWELDLSTRRVTWSETTSSERGRRPGRFAGTEEELLAATHVDDRDTVKQAIEHAIAERQDLAVVFRTLGRLGRTRWVECRGRVTDDAAQATPARIVGVSTDVTERKLLEAQLRQAQKMEAIGQLAGGVAHDFNNLLTAILGYAKFASDGLPLGDQRRHDVDEVIKAAQRAAGLTRQLLAFSRTQVLQSTFVDLNVLVTGITDMLRRLIGEHIALDLVLGPALALVKADAGQLEQVVMNLVVNARDAMEQGGRLRLETTNVELDAASGLPNQAVLTGEYVMLAVADNGMGMDETTKRHLFEPFFTTKERGHGTGLGLATVYGIVKQSGGYIWVDSEPGQGSKFRVYLPRAERQAQTGPPAPAPVPQHEGSETVLLVEDEAGVRDLARRMLEHAGYRVFDAASGADAELIFDRHRGSIDLLVTDVIMPGMTGPDLFRRLAVQQPALKVVFISGYASEAMARQLKMDHRHPHIQKPFTAQQLASFVRGVLDGHPDPGLKGAA